MTFPISLFLRLFSLFLLCVLTAMPLAAASVASSESPSGLYIVELVEAPLATYAGGVEGLAATQPAARGESRLDARSPASVAYLDYLGERQAAHLSTIGQALGRSPKVVLRYVAAANGFALQISSAEAQIVAGLPGVRRVTADRLLPLDTDRGPAWIGAPSIWDGTATGGLPGTMGEGVVVGILDSGVNMDHPSFAATGGDGFTHDNPLGPGVFLGWCDPSNPNHDPSYICNDKLIGAWDFVEAVCPTIPTCAEVGGPEDDDGHGSHTASTAAGNVLTSPEISGVAPHANVVTYDVCYVDTDTGQGLCPFSATSAAVDQAILDGVDVTNYSIGGGRQPWDGDIDTFFLGAVSAGIFPAASAGNAGPGPSTLGHLGPWMATNGASTHDRVNVVNELIDMTGGTSPPSDIDGASRTSGYGPAPIVYAGNFSNGDTDPEQCLNPFPPGTWSGGEIVLCDRGSIARVLKCAHVAAGGAAGCVLGNIPGGGTNVASDPHVIPATHIAVTGAEAVRTWLASGAGHMATITGGTLVTDPALADIMANFSSRGPNLSFNALKPDLTAPGVSIFAAVASGTGTPPPEFGTLNGTSMSSPHVAGSAALLRALYPDWTPAEIKSALMLTGDDTVLKENGVTPADAFDIGGGRVDLTKAAETALVMNETHANFLAANPNTGGLPETLNLASLQQADCVVGCSWNRTVTSVADGTTSWAVSAMAAPAGVGITADPSSFTLAPGEEQEIEVTADIAGAPLDVWAFAQLTLTQTGATAGSPTLQMPVAVRPVIDNLPELVEILATEDTGSETLSNRRAAVEITDLELTVAGLAEGAATALSLDEDTTNGDPYDDLGQVFVKTVSVPAGARRLIAATESDQAPDIDLYVGTGETPSAGTEVCSSTTPAASERCDLADPAAGTYWILVQNWSGSTAQPDDVSLVDGVVDGLDAGNFSADGPTAVPSGMEFDLALNWDIPTLEHNDVWFGVLDVGTDPGNPDNLGSIAIDLQGFLPGIFADGFESEDTSAWDNTVP